MPQPQLQLKRQRPPHRRQPRPERQHRLLHSTCNHDSNNCHCRRDSAAGGGDCNNDGVCRVDDLVLLNQYLLGGVQGSEVQRPAMDCNADGTVDSRDNQLLAMFLMQLIPRLPA
ncbi:MAG: dockerin type I repeat-containing protein [Ruminococcus callidus]